LKAQVSRLGMCSGSVRKEALQVLASLKFHGRGFESESVAAACILVALRSDRQAVSIRDIARKLDLNSACINKVFKFIERSTNVEVQGISEVW
jgi:transcription initiation factor TFIIIB Brf1 subunit/transcription initiation factor TFIIB